MTTHPARVIARHCGAAFCPDVPRTRPVNVAHGCPAFDRNPRPPTPQLKAQHYVAIYILLAPINLKLQALAVGDIGHD